ncbi:hypothetical protein GEMRC1_012992 [Eukaryota sp. GEM-RC1]
MKLSPYYSVISKVNLENSTSVSPFYSSNFKKSGSLNTSIKKSKTPFSSKHSKSQKLKFPLLESLDSLDNLERENLISNPLRRKRDVKLARIHTESFDSSSSDKPQLQRSMSTSNVKFDFASSGNQSKFEDPRKNLYKKKTYLTRTGSNVLNFEQFAIKEAPKKYMPFTEMFNVKEDFLAPNERTYIQKKSHLVIW